MKLSAVSLLVLAALTFVEFSSPLSKAFAQPEVNPSQVSLQFKGVSLPQPPQQNTSWQINAPNIPHSLLSSTQVLFEQGLADPRGAEYRSLQIKVGSVWGSSGVVTVHGWLLPTQPNDTGENRFAICWNGLEYPVLAVGPQEFLRSDVLALLDADTRNREESAESGKPFYHSRNVVGEGGSTSEKVLLPLKACLLLRLSEIDLAGSVWKAWSGGMDEKVNDNAEHLSNPYLMLAGDWTWSMFDRAVCSHMQGDDRLSLLDALELTRIRPLVEAEAGKRGFKSQGVFSDDWVQVNSAGYLSFLKPLPALLQDEERRVSELNKPEGKQPNGERAVPILNAAKSERIARFIAQLDEVSAHQWGQPGGVSLADDKIVKALIAEGDEAVEPLLNVVDNDERLTRSVSFGRDFNEGRDLRTVREAAYVALVGLLKTSTFGNGLPQEQPKGAAPTSRTAAMRAYWKRYKGVPLMQRWYATLNDEAAGSEAWLQAAGNIVRPTNIALIPGIGNQGTIEMPLRAGQKAAMTGETLRKNSNPTVSELLALRASQLGLKSEASSYNTILKEAACDMALDLKAWNPESALPVLQEANYALSQALRQQDTNYGSEGTYMLKMLLARASLNDKTALEEYKTWATTSRSDADLFLRIEVFAPLWQQPQNATLSEVSQFLFNDPHSRWMTTVDHATGVDSIFESQLPRSPGMKAHLLQRMEETDESGLTNLLGADRPNNKPELEISVDGTSFYRSIEPDPIKPLTGQFHFRVCDFYAWLLWDHAKQHPGAPRFELYWPLEKRNAALKESIAFLEKL